MFNDDTSSVKAVQENLKMHIMGQRYRAAHAKVKPIGDRMINAVRGAIWEAWEKGLDNDGENIYPRLPILDREPEQAVESPEAEQPEL
jgi:hypothetical protein